MTSRAYRARHRFSRNVGLACLAGLVAASAAEVTQGWTATTPWFWLSAIAVAFMLAIGGTSLLGYYVTGFSE